MHLGLALPYGDIGGDGPIVREFAELAEAEGYDGLTLADHVLGATRRTPPAAVRVGLACSTTPSWRSASSPPARKRSNSPPRC